MTRNSKSSIFISVIVPLYNKEKFIGTTINSVLQQTYKDFELIIVDDGSTDNSATVVKSIKDSRIRLIGKKNEGVSVARNTGIKESNGEWVFLLDADDRIECDALELFVKMINLYPKDKIFTAESIYLGSNIIQKLKIKKSRFPFWDTWRNNFSLGPGHTMIHKSLIEKFGGYDIRMSFYEDWEFSIRLTKYGRVVYCNKPVMKYNQQPSGLSNTFHSIGREMAYYIPEILGKDDTTFWERALLYENIEQEIAWWQGHPKELVFYRDMQRKHFAWYHKYLHWIRAQMRRHHLI